MPEIRPATSRDYPAVADLLSGSGLPTAGLDETLPQALVAVGADGRVAGCVALELYGDIALLRSLAVAAALRGSGLGERLAREALRLASSVGAHDVYLLTETAAGFFPRFGFIQEDRTLAPVPLKASVEFRSACPSSAVLMHLAVPA